MPNQTIYPISITILVPADYTFGNPTPEQAEGVINTWARKEQLWFKEQINKVFDYTLHIKYSGHPKSYFSPDSDACGNIAGTNAWGKIIDDVGWAQGEPSRNWITVMGAGGWSAGTKLGTHQHDIGWGVTGDFGIARWLGEPSACDPQWYFPETGFIVESLHSMGVDSENPLLVNFTLNMSREQKRSLLRYNKAFLL